MEGGVACTEWVQVMESNLRPSQAYHRGGFSQMTVKWIAPSGRYLADHASEFRPFFRGESQGFTA